MAYFVFCKILDSYPVFCNVREKSCNKTLFELFNTVSQVFPRFSYCLYYVEAIVSTYNVLGKSMRCRKCQNGYCRFGQVLGCDRGFLVETEFLVLCRDKGSLCHDMVLRL